MTLLTDPEDRQKDELNASIHSVRRHSLHPAPPIEIHPATATVKELNEPGYLSVVTVIETYGVLRRAYGVGTDQCAEVLEGLLNARDLRIGHDDAVRVALTASRGDLDLADALIAELGRAAGCIHTVTFDRRAARDGAMQLLGT